MKTILYNHNNLLDSDITEISIRLKVLLINSNNIILGYERGIYQFPGGHLEEGESFNECIKRELLEETGIEIEDYQIKEPIYKIIYMNKDYPESGKNRKSEAYYYVIHTDKLPDMTKTNYTEHELSGNFKLELIPVNSVIEKLKENKDNNSISKIVSEEMILVLEEYFKTRNIGDDNNESKSRSI